MVSAKMADPPSARSSRLTDGEHGVLQAHLLDGFGRPPRLVEVDVARPPGGDVAEGAGPGAPVAEQHQGGGALSPALVDVGATGFLAHGVEPQVPHQRLQVAVPLRSDVCLDPHPFGTRRFADQALADHQGNLVATFRGEHSVGHHPVDVVRCPVRRRGRRLRAGSRRCRGRTPAPPRRPAPSTTSSSVMAAEQRRHRGDRTIDDPAGDDVPEVARGRGRRSGRTRASTHPGTPGPRWRPPCPRRSTPPCKPASVQASIPKRRSVASSTCSRRRTWPTMSNPSPSRGTAKIGYPTS